MQREDCRNAFAFAILVDGCFRLMLMADMSNGTSDSDLLDRRDAIQRVAALLGASFAAPSMRVLIRAVEAASTSTGWRAQTLSPEQLEQVATVADHIIPRTDTPGAYDAGVHRFIDTMLADYYTSSERTDLLRGLADVDARARHAYRRAFLKCSPADQRALLEQLDRESFAPGSSKDAVANRASRETERGGGGLASSASTSSTHDEHVSAAACFRTLKQLTVLGYYTSQPGATRELRYVQVPGRFDGCVPLATVGRTWAT